MLSSGARQARGALELESGYFKVLIRVQEPFPGASYLVSASWLFPPAPLACVTMTFVLYHLAFPPSLLLFSHGLCLLPSVCAILSSVLPSLRFIFKHSLGGSDRIIFFLSTRAFTQQPSSLARPPLTPLRCQPNPNMSRDGGGGGRYLRTQNVDSCSRKHQCQALPLEGDSDLAAVGASRPVQENAIVY